MCNVQCVSYAYSFQILYFSLHRYKMFACRTSNTMWDVSSHYILHSPIIKIQTIFNDCFTRE